MTAEQDVFATQRMPAGVIYEGTVGWDGRAEVVEHGEEVGDGMTLIRVTLFTGHPPGKPVTDDGKANGYQIYARVMGPGWRTPKRGERVLLAIPVASGDVASFETPGAAVILGTVGASPSRRFGRKKTVWDLGDDDLVITAGTISLVTEGVEDGETKRHVISVSTQGGVQLVADGSGVFAKDGEVNIKTVDAQSNLKTAITLTLDEIGILDNNGTTVAMTVKDGNFTLVTGGFIALTYGSSISFGQTASPVTPVLLGLSGQTGAPSQSMFGSP